MRSESTGCFTCECGRQYEIPWSQIRFGESWPCRRCQRVIEIVCAEQWEPKKHVVSAPKNNVVPIRRAA